MSSKGVSRWNGCLRQSGMVLVIALMAILVAAKSSAQQSMPSPSLEIGNDRGGSLRVRLLEIRELRRTGTPVRITGKICYSTCTMFLGLPQTCVSPNTVFGFHGPSSYGRTLPPDVFDQASRLIVENYPEPLQQWYWDTARHDIWGLSRLSGAEMIRIGVAACQSS